MARPTHRLDIHYVPAPLDERALDLVAGLRQSWAERGWLDDGPGPLGRFRRLRVDDPGQVVLYANQVGGFQVRCPACSAPLAREFARLEPTTCPRCGTSSTTHELDCRPPVAVGRASLVLVDAQQADVPSEPGFRIVWRRL